MKRAAAASILVALLLLAVAVKAEAQPSERLRRIGVLLYLQEDDPEARTYVAAFLQGLQKLGWIVGRNVQIDYRWTAGDADRVRKYAAELVALAPDVILTAGSAHVGPLQQATRSVPIVFVQATDPVGGGLVNSLARPGGNATGFTNFELDISAKWLELLKQVAPRLTRVAVLRDPANPSGTGQFGAIQAVAPSFGVEEVRPVGLHDAGEIERGVTAFARESNGGLIVTPSGLAIAHREPIVKLAARHRLPAIYPFRYFVTDGGLISYGPDAVDQYRRAAGVDRILKGTKPADLPVQQPTKFELAINLKTAKALGLTVPSMLLTSADTVIK